MSGHRGGVQVLLKEIFSKAIYVHCNSHRLNLVLCTAAKASGHVSTFFDIVNQIHSFFTGAQRHARFMELQKEMHPDRQCMELERSCDTRWSSKSGSVHKILQLLDVLLEAQAEYAETSGQTKMDAEQLLQQIQTKKFLFMLVTFCKLFENSDFAVIYCVLDRQITELNCWFKEDTYGIMRGSASFVPASATFGVKYLLKGPCHLYGIEIADAEQTENGSGELPHTYGSTG